jgi:hypothetical protein
MCRARGALVRAARGRSVRVAVVVAAAAACTAVIRIATMERASGAGACAQPREASRRLCVAAGARLAFALAFATCA